MKSATVLLVGICLGGCATANDDASASAALDLEAPATCTGAQFFFDAAMLADLKKTVNPVYVHDQTVTVPGGLTAQASSEGTTLYTVLGFRTSLAKDTQTGETTLTAQIGGSFPSPLGGLVAAERVYAAMDVAPEFDDILSQRKASKDRGFTCTQTAWKGGTITECSFSKVTRAETVGGAPAHLCAQ